jgi:hypothetical protein
MASCVKMWLVLNICVKYAKCVKIWSFVWKFDFQWIFVSMFENMIICMKILLSLDISVKYAQCVKIWLFLKCVQFLEVLCSISGKAKGRGAYRTCISHLSKGRRACRTHVSHLSKGRRALWRHVSALLNMWKEYLQVIIHGIHLAPTRNMTVVTHTRTYVRQWAQRGPGARSTAWSTSYPMTSHP